MPISYTKRNLIPGERILYAASLHNFCFVFPVILLTVGIVLLCLPLLSAHLSGSEAVAEQVSSGYYGMAKEKLTQFLAFIASFLPDSVNRFLESANEVRIILLGALLTLLGVVTMVIAILKKISTEHVITTKRITFKKGFITVDESQITLYNVEGVKAFQTVLDRILNRGMVQVNGLGMEQLEIRGISDPNRFRHYAYTAVEKYSGRNQVPQHGVNRPPTPDYGHHLPGR